MFDYCECGHLEDDHKASFLQPCEVEGCDCEAFDHDEDADEKEDGE